MENDADDSVNHLTQRWLEAATQLMQACQPGAGTTASPELFRQTRADFVKIWSDWCEDVMRSPPFLQAQKQCLDVNLAVRKNVHANLRAVQRELQLAGRQDIDAVVAALRRAQRRILDQLEETTNRLQSVEAKLDRLSAQIERALGAAETAPADDADDPTDPPANGNGGRKKKQNKHYD